MSSGSAADLFEIVQKDPDVIRVHERLESMIAETVKVPDKQWELLEFVLTEFEPALASAVMSAVASLYPDVFQRDDRRPEDEGEPR